MTYYEVPDSDPPVTLKFQDIDTSSTASPWRPEPGRNETAVKKLLEKILDEYSIPAFRNNEMTDHEYEWEEAWNDHASGQERKVYVFVEPVEPKQGEEDRVLREGNWADTVRGLQDFLAAYPGLAVRFDTWVTDPQDPEEEEEFLAATAHLRMETLAKVAKVDVTS